MSEHLSSNQQPIQEEVCDSDAMYATQAEENEEEAQPVGVPRTDRQTMDLYGSFQSLPFTFFTK